VENARIALIEDNEGLRQTLSNILSLEHTITGEAGTLPEALELVDEIADGNVECDILITDYNLTSGVSSCEDGQAITERAAERIKRSGLPLFLIGYSGQAQSRPDIEVDVAIDKGGNPIDLLHAIKDL